MNSSDREIVNVSKNNKLFFETNQQAFTELLTFVDFVDSKLNIGFVEINFAQDRDILIEALIKHPDCHDIQFEVLNFSDPDLRFLRDELVEKLKQIKIDSDKKLVLLITGLEKSIGVVEEYPDVLVNINFVRDDLRRSVPHPILLFLPDYALTRLAKYAPDFWAWGRKVFYLKTIRSTAITTIRNVLSFKKNVDKLELQEKKERIDLLLRLLSEYSSSDMEENKRNLRSLIIIYHQLGNACHSLGEYQKAIDHYQQSLQVSQKIDDNTEIASALMGLGNAYYFLGEYPRVINYYQQSLQISQELGDRRSIVISLGNLGFAYYCLREYQKAIDYYQQSLHIEKQIEDHMGIASSLMCLGTAYYSLKKYLKAINYYQQSLKILQELGDSEGIASSLMGLGNTYDSLEDYPKAIDYYQQSLKFLQDINNPRGIATSFGNLGNAYYSLEDYSKAIDYYQQSLKIRKKLGDRNGEAITWFNLGNTYKNLQQKKKAKKAYENAKKLYKAMGLDEDVEKCDRAIQDLENQ